MSRLEWNEVEWRPQLRPVLQKWPRGQGLETWTIKVFYNLELCAGVIPVTSDAGVTLYPHGSD